MYRRACSWIAVPAESCPQRHILFQTQMNIIRSLNHIIVFFTFCCLTISIEAFEECNHDLRPSQNFFIFFRVVKSDSVNTFSWTTTVTDALMMELNSYRIVIRTVLSILNSRGIRCEHRLHFTSVLHQLNKAN